MAMGAFILYRKSILTRYASLAAYLLGIYFFAILGLDWLIPVLFFFLSSVLFTRLNARLNNKPVRSDRRNIWQVLANILVATVCSAFYLVLGNEIWLFFYITLVAAVTADTWASEIGPIFNRKCFSLADGKLRDAGVSGGVSFAGSLAAILGAFCISFISCFLLMDQLDWKLLILLTLAGFLASFVDSVLGAFVEPRLLAMKYFRRPRHSVAVEKDRITPNDLVNLIASITAPLFFIILNLI
jgi:uncharacterized protein (TIGR00297 family)